MPVTGVWILECDKSVPTQYNVGINGIASRKWAFMAFYNDEIKKVYLLDLLYVKDRSLMCKIKSLMYKKRDES